MSVYPSFTHPSCSEVPPCTVKSSCPREIHYGICRGGGVNPLIRNLGMKFSEWSDSCLSRFIPGETDTASPSVGVWMGRKADLEVMKKREPSFLARAGNGTTICVFCITNEMQLIQCSLLLSALYTFWAVFPPIIRSL